MNIFRIALVVIGFVVLALAGGLVGIWALNTLFALGIPYTFKTALASALLAAAVGGAGRG